MVELKAILVASGRAFFKQGACYFHISPPYTQDSRVHIVSATMGAEPFDITAATNGYGYEREEKNFETDKALADYLLERYNQWAFDNKISDVPLLSLSERMRIMPPAMFKVFLKNLKAQLLLGKYGPVIAMGTDMLENVYSNELKVEMDELNSLVKLAKGKVENEASVTV